MKLTRVEIKNYRSVFHDYDTKTSFEIELGDGVNSLTGPNNAGKSNVLRALALALDPDFEFNRQLDMPSVWEAWSKPVVTLTFQIPLVGTPSRERTLLKRLGEYEKQVKPGGAKTYASMGEVRLRVAIEQGAQSRGVRRRTFLARGAGARQLGYDDVATHDALAQFDKCLQFVMIRSGESLESLLQGRFREVLETVLRDELRAEFDAADRSRADYVQALQDGVLTSLRERIASELVDLFPEVNAVSLEPNVRSLEDTLTSMNVRVSDVAVTDLADKGTGVRGGLIVAMLQHLATNSKRSIVFAVEEPESFLHPAAQEALCEDLEALADRSDVSLLITTHSPYVISRKPDARVIAVRKEPVGRTVLHKASWGHEPMQDVLGGLFRSSLVVGYLDRAAQAVDGEKGILVVEGETDKSWLRLAAELTGRSDLLDGLTIVAPGDGLPGGAGGATMAVMQALILKSASENPVAILLDNDPDGEECLQLMKRVNSKTKEWGVGKRVFSYRMAIDNADGQFPYEAEDLWPDELHKKFLKKAGEDGVLAERCARPNPRGGFHFGYTPKAKPAFAMFLERTAKAKDCDDWVKMLETIRQGMGI